MEVNYDLPHNGAFDDEEEDVEMARQECIVSSELLPFLDQDRESQPIVDAKNIVSKFSFVQKLVPKDPESDEDGDLIVSRANDIKHSIIYTEHSTSTPLDSVGLQVWRGALLLADWALHHADLLTNATVLELGSGTGLSAIAAATVAREVVATDANIGNVLSLIKSNVERNIPLLRNSIRVMEFDFFNDEWSSELADVASRTSIVLTADVIYDDILTEALVKTLKRLLSTPPSKTIYMALEKRYPHQYINNAVTQISSRLVVGIQKSHLIASHPNKYVFTLADFDSVAPCFEHFLRCINKPDFPWQLESISCDFPQYFNYQRTKELAMWKIVSNS